ncbi:hypothetical protein RHS01_02050 [Rhizoctonia solani]|uniref:Uncharacterized protein n=1 Tax=Rhizoctonia solani TaxID=456999 RepID=A0A8H7IIN1_9AGAM|nr:hypothetical protein RHS01_02050 [Rhizoctonia solani]
MTRHAVGKATKPLASAVGAQPVSQTQRFSPAFRGRKTSVILDNDQSNNVIVNPKLLKMHKNALRVPVPTGMLQQVRRPLVLLRRSLTIIARPLDSYDCYSFRATRRVNIFINASIYHAFEPSPSSLCTPSTRAGYLYPLLKESHPLLAGKGRHRGLFPGAEVHPLLEDQITSGLQARCVEEAELVANSLRTTARYKPGEPAAFTIRRLTEVEYELVQNQSKIQDPKVMAVLVVPKVEDDPGTDAKATQKSQFLARGDHFTLGTKAPPIPRIPIYWTSSLFQDPASRTALRKALDSALDSERTAIQTARKSQPKAEDLYKAPYESKSRVAYAICASRRVDAVPLAIAFWRLRLWEGISDNQSSFGRTPTVGG